MLEKDCSGNPVSTIPPCYAIQMIFTAFSPRLIQYVSRNVHKKIRALKRLCAACRVMPVKDEDFAVETG